VGEPDQDINRLLDLRLANKAADAWQAFDQPLLLKQGESLTHGHPADPQLLSQLALRWEPIADLKIARADLLGEALSDLHVNSLGVPPDESHV